MTRREFIEMGGALAAAATTAGCAGLKGRSTALDQDLIVLLSDIHICGTRNAKGEIAEYPHTHEYLRRQVVAILAGPRVPANVIVTGDVAYDIGCTEDYAMAWSLLKPLADAGIRVTLGMGNHDKREPFLGLFPDYAKATPVPGRIVSVVETPKADFILLDSLDAKPGREYNTVSGRIDGGQPEWLEKVLPTWKKPVFLASHHPWREPPLRKVISPCASKAPQFVGYIYGHVHYWHREKEILWNRPNKVLPTVAMPSAGFYGDIGRVELDLRDDRAVATLVQDDFFYPKPAAPGARPPEWDAMVADNRGENCTFLFPGSCSGRPR